MKGTYTALVTPFSYDGINIEKLKELIEFQYENGSDGVVLLGTTGESPTISEKESDTIISAGLEACEEKLDVLVGCSSCDTAEAVKNAGERRRSEQKSYLCLLLITTKRTARECAGIFLR